jgi:hypothetical protein
MQSAVGMSRAAAQVGQARPFDRLDRLRELSASPTWGGPRMGQISTGVDRVGADLGGTAEGGEKRGCKAGGQADAVGDDAGKKVKGRKLQARWIPRALRCAPSATRPASSLRRDIDKRLDDMRGFVMLAAIHLEFRPLASG